MGSIVEKIIPPVLGISVLLSVGYLYLLYLSLITGLYA